jgi:hypothetical protein
MHCGPFRSKLLHVNYSGNAFHHQPFQSLTTMLEWVLPMKARIFCVSALLVTYSLFTSVASAVTFPVRTDSGTQYYQLEVPPGITPDAKHLQDPWGMPYSAPGNTPGTGNNVPISAGAAEVAAVAWAGGTQDFDKPSGVSNYPNSLTILGGKTPGGFYNASFVHPTHVERVEGPTSYYLVTMTGVVANEHQTLYAAVLDDGRLVRPTPASHPVMEERPARHHIVRHHRHE